MGSSKIMSPARAVLGAFVAAFLGVMTTVSAQAAATQHNPVRAFEQAAAQYHANVAAIGQAAALRQFIDGRKREYAAYRVIVQDTATATVGVKAKRKKAHKTLNAPEPGMVIVASPVNINRKGGCYGDSGGAGHAHFTFHASQTGKGRSSCGFRAEFGYSAAEIDKRVLAEMLRLI